MENMHLYLLIMSLLLLITPQTQHRTAIGIINHPALNHKEHQQVDIVITDTFLILAPLSILITHILLGSPIHHLINGHLGRVD